MIKPIFSLNSSSDHLTQSEKDTLLLQRLERAIFPATIYLTDAPKTSYLPTSDTTPATLPILTIYHKPENKVYNHVLLPRSLHPILSIKYAPSRELEVQGTLVEKTYWVGFDLSCMHNYKETSDFITALDQMEIGGMAFIVDDPAQAPVKAFMMEITGVFRNEDDILASAKRQVNLLDKMVFGKYVTLGPEVLEWTEEEDGYKAACTPERFREYSSWGCEDESVSGSGSRKAFGLGIWFQ
ncbi:uncharacterized protein N7496_002964 [Penicillium cataractarum]|uniref:Uncharacterized protein n=1 Tax=Penicillium cataractarum TaxID=2100454 RepID=A0A9W9SL33_9EURO|nr:uncharacterized protein N7496_002964 [Penicillium cataractarum]KAJ5380536.1 hypothetical protein N7496_002964 [Penicillium cataractarum]